MRKALRILGYILLTIILLVAGLLIYVKTALHEYLTDLEDAFAADAAIDVFEVEGRRSRPLSALEAETDR